MTDRRQTDDRQQTDRQTDKSNPSLPYSTFACFTGLIIITIIIIIVDKFNISLAPREGDFTVTNKQLKSVIAII